MHHVTLNLPTLILHMESGISVDLSNLPKILQLLNDRTGAFWLLSLYC